MITTVRLYGELGKRFGRKHEFDLWCAKEAVEAMEMAKPGFKHAIAAMRKHVFRVRVGKRYITEDRLYFPNNGKTISITPILEGAVSAKGIIQIIAGVVLIAAGFYLGPESGYWGMMLIGAGLGLALGGVASLLAPGPPQTQKDAKNSASYIFNEAVNTTQQGGAIQFILGYPFHGTQIISADVVPVDIAIGSEGEVDPGDGESLGSGPDEPAHPAYAH